MSLIRPKHSFARKALFAAPKLDGYQTEINRRDRSGFLLRHCKTKRGQKAECGSYPKTSNPAIGQTLVIDNETRRSRYRRATSGGEHRERPVWRFGCKGCSVEDRHEMLIKKSGKRGPGDAIDKRLLLVSYFPLYVLFYLVFHRPLPLSRLGPPMFRALALVHDSSRGKILLQKIVREGGQDWSARGGPGVGCEGESDAVGEAWKRSRGRPLWRCEKRGVCEPVRKRGGFLFLAPVSE